MTRGMYSMPPKRWRPKANWIVMTMPMKIDVTATIPSDRTPSESIWRTSSTDLEGALHRRAGGAERERADVTHVLDEAVHPRPSKR